MARIMIWGFVVSLAAAVVLADKPAADPTTSVPKSVRALNAIHHTDDTVKGIQAACRKQIATTRETEVVQLQDALMSATKSGDLDEALRIRAAIQAVQSEVRKAETDLDQKYAGFWRFRGNTSNGYILFNDGTARYSYNVAMKAAWLVKNHEVIIDWGDSNADGFTLESGTWVHRIYHAGKVVKTLLADVDFPE